MRVTVVVDCALTRRALTDELSGRPGIDATVTASLAAAPDGLDTDILVLDLKLAGRGRLDLIRRTASGLPVVLLTGSGSGDPGRALDALLAGATSGVVGVVHLPSGRVATAVRDAVRADLLPLLLALRSAVEPMAWCTPLPGPVPGAVPPSPLAAAAFGCLVIGSGRTGLPALADLLAALPPDLPVPVTVAQQLPGGFETVFTQRLLARSAVPVELAGDDLDETFRRAANRYGEGTLGVVLNGPGRAGVHGATAVRAAGGTVLAEAEERGRVWGLPGAVALAGQADRLVPLDDLPAALTVLLAVALTPTTSAATGRHAHEHLEVHA